MSDAVDLNLSNHRRQQRLTLIASLIVLLFSFAPRNERALFLSRDPELKALSAIVEPEPVTMSFPGRLREGPVTAFFARLPRQPGGARTPDASGALPDALPQGPPAAPFAPGPGAVISPGAPEQIARNIPPGGGSGFPFGPPGLSPSPASPVDSSTGGGTTSTSSTGGTTSTSSTGGTTSTSSTGGTTSSTGGTTSSTGGTASSSSGGNPIVPGVPEPASWMLMILGFGAAGFALRRRSVDVQRSAADGEAVEAR